RLGQIVVRADFQAENAVHIVSTGGENEDGNRGTLPQAAENLEPGHAGQHQIEDDKAVSAGDCLLQAALAVVYRIECESLAAEPLDEQPAEFHVVIDDQHTIHLASMVARGNRRGWRLYKTLCSFTNLYRTRGRPVLESSCGRKEK